MQKRFVIFLVGILGTAISTPCFARSAPPLKTIPLEPYLRAQAVVRATVNGQAGGVLFDTVGGVSMGSPPFAKQIACRPWGRLTGFRMSGERLDSPHCDGLTFDLGGQALHTPVVGILDIMALLGPDVPP